MNTLPALGQCPQFASYWAAFLSAQRTCPITQDLMDSWSRGRPTYAVWLVRVKDPAVSERMGQVRAPLSPFLRADDLRDPHITLAACGFPCQAPSQEDDFSEAMFAAQLNRLTEVEPAPFVVDVLGAGSFPGTPILEVRDTHGQLRALHNCLNTWSDVPYVPHVTFGHYSDAVTPGLVAERLAPFLDLPPLSIEVTSISLATYDVSSVCGPLTEVCRYDLASRRLTWVRPFLLGYAAAGSTRH